MGISERILEIRTDAGMSRSAFGEALGVSGDVVNNLERNRLKNLDQKEPLFRLLCERFNVNYVWLTTGDGEKNPPKPTDDIEAIVTKHGLSPQYAAIFRSLLSLPPEKQDTIVQFVLDTADALRAAEKKEAGEKKNG